MRSRRRPTPKRQFDKSLLNLNKADKDQRFCKNRLALYMLRYMEVSPDLDLEALQMMEQILGRDMERLYESAADLVRRKSGRLGQGNTPEGIGEDGYDLHALYSLLMKLDRQGYGAVIAALRKLLSQACRNSRYRGYSSIEKKMAALGKMLDLTDQEKELCYFLLINATYKPADSFFVDHLQCQAFQGKKYLGIMLRMSSGEIDGALGGSLKKLDMIEMSKAYFQLKDEFVDFFVKYGGEDLQSRFFVRMNRQSIPLGCHFIDPKETDHLLKLLKDKPNSATHILLYGAAGTGKTSYARGLARKLRVPTYEIVRDQENKTETIRTAVYVCLNMTSKGSGSIIIVDEADNVLNTRGAWLTRGETQDKGWLNELMEVPEARIIWITNTIENIEPSVRRRFAYSIHFRPFSRKQRAMLWESVLKQNRVKGCYSRDQLDQLAGRYKVSAGAIDLAVKKAMEVSLPAKPEFNAALTMALESHQVLLNEGERPSKEDDIERCYSLEGLNVDSDTVALVKQLESFDHHLRTADTGARHNMNLLFHGPPGTGKSELARYIARRLDREIICKRASDILDPYVGMTERKIRDAFEEAEREDAVLVIDEADTMLFNRDKAQRSWEISFTNEFLTRMERYRGILICTTNRLGGLDTASIRRFNHKVGFQYLTPVGNEIFYKKLLSHLACEPLGEEHKAFLHGMTNLAPGDFRVVRDQFSFNAAGRVAHRELLNALSVEARLKEGKDGEETRRVGF
jgi:transitional endoplasmic reticulum ATPase